MTFTEPVPPAAPERRDSASGRRRRSRFVMALNIALALTLIGGAVGVGAIWTNTWGLGDKWQNLLDKIDLALNPPPDRETVQDVEVESSPEASVATSPPATASLAPGATARPTLKPTPKPARKKVDVRIIRDPAAIFEHEVNEVMCAAAGVQMVLRAHGKGEGTTAFQRELERRVKEWESLKDSRNGKWGPTAMVEALAAYGVEGYQVRTYKTRNDALVDAARAITTTRAPAILLAWRGAHTWIMSGYRANADPLVFDDVTITGAYILDPWYPDVSSIWGPSDEPGAFQDAAEMERNFLPWKRPEGAYPKRDGKFIVVVPTKPLPGD